MGDAPVAKRRRAGDAEGEGAAAGATSPERRIVFNARGTELETSVETVMRHDWAYAAQLRSGMGDAGVQRFFVDHNAAHFDAVLTYLRTGAVTVPAGGTKESLRLTLRDLCVDIPPALTEAPPPREWRLGDVRWMKRPFPDDETQRPWEPARLGDHYELSLDGCTLLARRSGQSIVAFACGGDGSRHTLEDGDRCHVTFAQTEAAVRFGVVADEVGLSTAWLWTCHARYETNDDGSPLGKVRHWVEVGAWPNTLGPRGVWRAGGVPEEEDLRDKHEEFLETTETEHWGTAVTFSYSSVSGTLTLRQEAAERPLRVLHGVPKGVRPFVQIDYFDAEPVGYLGSTAVSLRRVPVA